MLMYRKFSLWDQEVKISFKIAIIIYAPKKREREGGVLHHRKRVGDNCVFHSK